MRERLGYPKESSYLHVFEWFERLKLFKNKINESTKTDFT